MASTATSAAAASGPAHSSGSTRKLGQGYSLALKTGGNPETHCSLVYFNSCKRGYEQTLVKSMAETYFRDTLGIQTVDFVLGERFNERSVLVKSTLIDKICADLRSLFSNFDIDHNQVAHIDLRGNSVADITTQGVSVIDNWLY